jgi:catechol 2,3-dioxygenase-like lactoylglutathione lyase family enzyme
MRIGSIVIHCHEFDRMVESWQEALHYFPGAPAKDGRVVLCDPEGKGPNLSFQARETRAPHRSWIHLDLYSPVRDQEVVRLVALGALRYTWKYRSGANFVVLEDPDGNLFCVVQRS